MNTRAPPPLLETLPDLVLAMRRDGTISNHVGGRSVPRLMPQEAAVGQRIDALWPAPVAQLVVQLVKKVLASRTTLEVRFDDAGHRYQVRVSAEGPDRALCVIRAELPSVAADDTSPSGERRRPYLDRRGFLRQFQESLSLSVLTEKPAAVIVIQLDGVDDIARIDPKLAEQVVMAALTRLSQDATAEGLARCSSLGQLSENQLALVIDTTDRQAVETLIAELFSSLTRVVRVADAQFRLAPYAGVAVLGRDATSTKMLLDQARIAAGEARRSEAKRARFFSDTMKLQSHARVDVARELRDAIAARQIRVRYVGRHDLATGQLVTRVSYASWAHPLRGPVPPSEFLAVAEATGTAVEVSRALLDSLRDDFLQRHENSQVSYGPLRNHLLHDDFPTDIERFLADGGIPAARLEVRLAESTFIVLPPAVCQRLHRIGVQLVIDEVGRGLGSLDRLARAPLWGMQLDRAWVEALCLDEVAQRVCRVGVLAAMALGLSPIATGVDTDAQRLALLALGCRYGSGDLYGGTPVQPKF